jgi:hypothetical protein
MLMSYTPEKMQEDSFYTYALMRMPPGSPAQLALFRIVSLAPQLSRFIGWVNDPAGLTKEMQERGFVLISLFDPKSPIHVAEFI